MNVGTELKCLSEKYIWHTSLYHKIELYLLIHTAQFTTQNQILIKRIDLWKKKFDFPDRRFDRKFYYFWYILINGELLLPHQLYRWPIF